MPIPLKKCVYHFRDDSGRFGPGQCYQVGRNRRQPYIAFKGQLPLGFVVLKEGAEKGGDELVQELVQMVRSSIGAVAAFKQALIVKRLPKTRSGKILRGTMRSIANNKEYKMPSTIDDPAILGEITETLTQMGYVKK